MSQYVISPSQTKVVVFDLDGTLFDHRSASDVAIVEWACSNSLPDSPEQIVSRWRELEQEWFGRYERGEVTFADQRRNRMRGMLGFTYLSDEQCDREFASYARLYEQAWLPFDDATGCLERLAAAGFRLAMLTNGDAEQQVAKVESIGLAPYFEQVFVSSTIGFAKPDPEVFAYVAQALHVTLEDCLMVGDSIVNDFWGARNVGMLAVLIDRSGQRTNQATIHSLDELVVEGGETAH